MKQLLRFLAYAVLLIAITLTWAYLSAELFGVSEWLFASGFVLGLSWRIISDTVTMLTGGDQWRS